MSKTVTRRTVSPPGRGASLSRAVPAYLFVAPAALLLVTFGILPILVALIVSLTDMDISGLANRDNVGFVGFDNYRRLFEDSDFRQAAFNTLLFVGMGVPIVVVGSMFIAIGLNMRDNRYFRLLRGIYFLPAITAIVAISVIWGYLYNTDFGLFNYLLETVGLPAQPWLAEPWFARVSVVVVAIWRATGLNIILFCAALQSIPKEYHEAAALDGASRWKITLFITVPLLKFATFFVTVTTLIAWLQFFDEPFVLTDGGPAGSTTSVSLYIYQSGFRFNEFGFSSAASAVLFVGIFAVTALQMKLRGSDDN
jgi:multiple sugar transport system permease protein